MHVESDFAAVRQHLGALGGVHINTRPGQRLKPYGGLGIAWIVPDNRLSGMIEKRLTVAGEGFVGVDWDAVRDVRLFGELRVHGASYPIVMAEPICNDCYSETSRSALHVGRTGWLGARVKLF